MFSDLRPIDVIAAAARIRDVVPRTPLRRSAALSELAGGDVFLKLETEQITGSFKLRGAFNSIAMLDEETKRRGVVASSAGNHGLGVAWAARHFGVPAKIFVPRAAPEVKKKGIAMLGAEVDATAADYDVAMEYAKKEAAAEGKLFINPCLGDPLLAGQGTVALEILEELPEVRAIVTPVGGGGLLGGVGAYVRPVAPEVRIIGAQSVNTAAMSRSVAADRLVEIESVPTLADGLAGQIDEEALSIGRSSLDEIVTLEEEEIAEAIRWLSRTENVTAEGAGAVAVGALLHGKAKRLSTPAAVIVSGRNIDEARLGGILNG